MQTKKLLTVRDVMHLLCVSRRTIYYWIEDGILKAVKIGSIYRFHPEDIDRLISIEKSTIPGKSAPRILAVDDDILVRESLKPLLERNGFAVKVAANGQEALDFLRKEDFDLILTDMRMAPLNGLETLRAVRQLRQEQKKELIPEIVVTAYEDAGIMAEAKALGVCDFIMKPFEVKDFLAVLRKNLGINETQHAKENKTKNNLFLISKIN